MTAKDIKIKVTGIQNTAGVEHVPEVLEFETTGVFYEKDGKCYIKYDEYMEEAEAPVKNLLRFDDEVLQLTKRGGINTVMVFDREKNSSVHYVTPYGAICMNICTEDYHMEKTGEGVYLDVLYCIDFNYDYITECSLNVSADYCQDVQG